MKIIRVFPRRTNYTPADDMVFVGPPPGLLIPPHDEIHISCVFTWDKAYCDDLKYQWQMYSDKPVRTGGPAYLSPCGTFAPGMYVRRGIVFTSRGCNNNCPFCVVPRGEGKIKELPDIHAGNIIQDNNFLMCSKAHKDRVFEMLKSQRGICFKGGLQCSLIDGHFIGNIRQLRISELWLACDTPSAVPGCVGAIEKLKRAGFTREHIRCYVLIGGDLDENERRLQAVYKAGAMPFAMLYQPLGDKKLEYDQTWKKFHRMWSRPAAIVSHCERGTNMWDFGT